MLSVEEFLDDFLSHEQPYDPAKAREYYLRNRKLKGRRPGQIELPGGRTPAKTIPKGVRPAAKSKVTAAQRKKATEARVAALEVRLDKLKKVLALLVKQAKARSGVESENSADKAKKEAASSKKDDSDLSAKQKADKAKKAKEAYEKEKAKAPNVADLEAKIKEVADKIAKMRAELAAAKSKAKPAPVGAGSKSQRKGDSQNGS